MSPPENNNKICLTCGKVLKGRLDKKYCDDGCRNSYNNRLKSETNNFVRNVNNALAKNRRILESLLPPEEETAKANKEKLLRLGFQFKYITYTYVTKAGKTYFYCYEYGYLPLENNWYLIVKSKKE